MPTSLFLHDIPVPMIRAAKALLPDAPLVQVREAVPGCGKAIATSWPKFACSFALIQQPTVEKLVAALRWYLFDEPDARIISAAGWLSHAFGATVTEVTIQEESKVRFQ